MTVRETVNKKLLSMWNFFDLLFRARGFTATYHKGNVILLSIVHIKIFNAVMYDWLVNNVGNRHFLGTESSDGRWYVRHYFDDRSRRGYEVGFVDEEKALLFKLTFA